ncbi:MAG: zinc-finger domain-containing protein [Burkholderiaceae bacterium]
MSHPEGSSTAVVELQARDLPAYCPNPQMPLWSGHPRVFLDLTEGRARCPYCGTEYRLVGGPPAAH